MSFNSLLIQYHGFHPSTFTQNYLSSMMEELYDESPAGSILRATFSRKDKVIKGVVQITSGAGPFFAVASGTGLKEVSKKLTLQMRRRLEKWKSKRLHHNESLKNISSHEENSEETFFLGELDNENAALTL